MMSLKKAKYPAVLSIALLSQLAVAGGVTHIDKMQYEGNVRWLCKSADESKTTLIITQVNTDWTKAGASEKNRYSILKIINSGVNSKVPYVEYYDNIAATRDNVDPNYIRLYTETFSFRKHTGLGRLLYGAGVRHESDTLVYVRINNADPNDSEVVATTKDIHEKGLKLYSTKPYRCQSFF